MIKSREALVGAVVIVAFVVLGVFTVIVGNIRWPWRERAGVKVKFENVEGLKKGDEVRLRGMQVGRVADLEDLDGQAILAVLELERPVAFYEAEPATGSRPYSIKVRSVTPLGGRYVALFPGNRGENNRIEVTEDTVLQGSAVGDPLAEVEELAMQLKTIVGQLQGGEGLLGALITDESLREDFRSTVRSVKNVAGDLEAGKGTLGRLLRDEALAQNLADTVAGLNTVVKNIEKGQGILGKLATEETLYNDLAATAKSIRAIAGDIQAGKGTIGRLYSDETLYTKAADALKGFGDLGRNISESKGFLGRLANDPQLADDLQGGIAALADTLRTIKEGQGTLGMLLKDKAVYEKANTLFTTLNELVDDFRNQAPVSLFAGLLTLGL